MTTITINTDEHYLIEIIKDLMDIDSTWKHCNTAGDMLEINFTGDSRIVKQAILKRLTVPERLQYIFTTNLYKEINYD